MVPSNGRESQSPEEREGRDYWEKHMYPESSWRSHSSVIKGKTDNGKQLPRSPHPPHAWGSTATWTLSDRLVILSLEPTRLREGALSAFTNPLLQGPVPDLSQHGASENSREQPYALPILPCLLTLFIYLRSKKSYHQGSCTWIIEAGPFHVWGEQEDYSLRKCFHIHDLSSSQLRPGPQGRAGWCASLFTQTTLGPKS